MRFGEKVKAARKELGLTQRDLADQIGVSLRTVQNYEIFNRYPKQREIYAKLSLALKVPVNYLLSEEEEFLDEAARTYGSRGQQQAAELVAAVNGLFAGGQMAEEDMDEMMKAIQEAYWIAKEKNRKYAKGK